MEAIGSSETSVATQRTTRRHIPEDDTLHLYLIVYIYNITFLKLSCLLNPAFLLELEFMSG
jgi:hypothetical protein